MTSQYNGSSSITNARRPVCSAAAADPTAGSGWLGPVFSTADGGRHALLEAGQVGSCLLLFSGLAGGLEESHVALNVDAEAGAATGSVSLRESRHLKRIQLGIHSPVGEPIIACGAKVTPLGDLLAE